MLDEYDIRLGQGSGPKEVEGDHKTPTGMYFVIQKHSGVFDGPYAAYFGGYWIRFNYPEAGLKEYRERKLEVFSNVDAMMSSLSHD